MNAQEIRNQMLEEINTPKQKNFITLHPESVIESFSSYELFSIKDELQELNPLFSSLIEEKIATNEQEFLNDFFLNTYSNKTYVSSLSEDERNEIAASEGNYAFCNILKDLLENEGLSYTDIKIANSGSFSSVLIIGNEVLKIGRTRNTFEIPDSKYILRPYVRSNFSIKDGLEDVCIEVSDKVIPCTKDTISVEELFDIYSSLRKEGIVACDLKPDNIGILDRPNVPTWQGVEIPKSNNSFMGILENDKKEQDVLQKNDFVILDTDFLIKDEDFDLHTTHSTQLSSQFNELYSQLEDINDEMLEGGITEEEAFELSKELKTMYFEIVKDLIETQEEISCAMPIVPLDNDDKKEIDYNIEILD